MSFECKVVVYLYTKIFNSFSKASVMPVGKMCSRYRMAEKFLKGIHYSSIRR